MDYRLLNPGRFIKSAAFGDKDLTFTIAAVTLEQLEDESGAKKAKGICRFREQSRVTGTPLEWVLNVTNASAVAAMFGKDTDGWIGRRVTLYAAPYKGDTAIRVRGSPDIDREIRFTLKLAKKKPQEVVLKPTGKGKAPAPADPHEPSFDEIPPEPGAEG